MINSFTYYVLVCWLVYFCVVLLTFSFFTIIPWYELCIQSDLQHMCMYVCVRVCGLHLGNLYFSIHQQSEDMFYYKSLHIILQTDFTYPRSKGNACYISTSHEVFSTKWTLMKYPLYIKSHYYKIFEYLKCLYL